MILGENNAGKTALLCAVRLVFDRSGRLRPDLPDFYQGIVDFTKPPTISVTATLRSSTADTIDRQGPSWQPGSPSWTPLGKHSSATNSSFPTKKFQRSPRHLVRHPFAATNSSASWSSSSPSTSPASSAGSPENRLVAEPDALAKFDCHTVDAIRDVESELFAGTNPLLRTMLRQVLDHDADEAETLNRRRHFRTLTQDARSNLTGRMNLDALFQLAKDTGSG